MPDRAVVYLLNNLLSKYLWNSYCAKHGCRCWGCSNAKENSPPGAPPHPCRDLPSVWPTSSCFSADPLGMWAFTASFGAVGMPFLDPREQGPGCFCAEKDVRVCVSQYFDQRHTAVTWERLGNVIWVPQGTDRPHPLFQATDRTTEDFFWPNIFPRVKY